MGSQEGKEVIYKISIWVALLLSAAALLVSLLKKTPKIGYAETNVLMSEFSEAIQAKKEFENSQKDWDKNLKALNDSMLAAMSRMKIQYDAAGKAARDSMRKDFENRNDNYQKYVEAVRKMSQDKERELMDPVIRKINSFLEIWGKEKGYELILGTMQGGNILQASQGINLTSEILKDINAHYRNLPVASPKTTSGTPSASDSLKVLKDDTRK